MKLIIVILCVVFALVVMIDNVRVYIIKKSLENEIIMLETDINSLNIKLDLVKQENKELKDSKTKLVYVGMDHKRLRVIIRHVLEYLDIPNSTRYVDLLLYTALVESNLGIRTKQARGPALSPFQIEPTTENSIINIFLKRNPIWKSKIMKLKSKISVVGALETNLEYSIAMTTMLYIWRHKVPPAVGDWKAIAQYHKEHFNTYLGKACPNNGYELAMKVFN